jgi:hypothetical protein
MWRRLDTTGWSPLSTNYCVLMYQCDRWGCRDLHTNLKSGIIGESCSLRSASASSLFLHLLLLSYWIAKMQQFSKVLELRLGRVAWYSESLLAGRSGDRIPVTTRFSAPVQTGSGAHSASCTMSTRSVPTIKRPGRGIAIHRCLAPRLKKESYTPTTYLCLSGRLWGELYLLKLCNSFFPKYSPS